MILFFKGLAIGFAMAVPVGPVGLLCIRHTLNHGLKSGLLSGLGAALADAVFGGVAGAGLSSVADLLFGFEDQLRVGGGVFLILLGLRTFLKASIPPDAPTPTHGAVATAFLLTITNPMTLLAFLGFFVTFDVVAEGGEWRHIAVLVAAIFVGSGLWWCLLCTGVVELRRRIDESLMVWINRCSAVAIAGFGIVVLINALL